MLSVKYFIKKSEASSELFTHPVYGSLTETRKNFLSGHKNAFIWLNK